MQDKSRRQPGHQQGAGGPEQGGGARVSDLGLCVPVLY